MRAARLALFSDVTTRFVILAAPRTGSNWLCTLLDSHPRVLCHREIFNPEGIHTALSLHGTPLDLGDVAERDRDPAAVLRRVWGASFGRDAVGFKLNRESTPAVFPLALDDRGVRKVVLRRRNRVRTFVSERVAAQTGEWEGPSDHAAGARVALTVDARALRAHVAANARYYDGLTARLAASGQGWIEVRYERLGEPAEHERLLGFLGLQDTRVTLLGATRRQNPQPLRELIANFDDLADRLRGSSLEDELHDA